MSSLGRTLGCWVEAMRLRTLPVSVAGVFVAVGMAISAGSRLWLPACLCLAFAVLAQIASNFANEYYDFKSGLDRAGRDGPRRGVTEGDITPRAMLCATLATLAVACAIGCSLIYWGGWWMLPAGILIALGVMAYSAGPYPLSRHGLGEVAVVIYFGIVPVNLTYYLLTGGFTLPVLGVSVAFGMMGANVLIVNNYRDYDDDAAVGKRTLAVMRGRRFMGRLYLANGFLASLLLLPWVLNAHIYFLATVGIYLLLHLMLWRQLTRLTGAALNPLLGKTAILMLAIAIAILLGALSI